MRYRPQHTFGEVLVGLRESFGEETARGLARQFGYEYKGWNETQGAYLFGVPDGAENMAIRRLKRASILVETADRRDVKFERWCAAYDALQDATDGLLDALEKPDAWASALERIITQANEAKKLI